jgi:hypothetical protein
MVDDATNHHSATRVERVFARHLRADKSEFLTLEYIVSFGAIVASLMCLDAAVKAAFTLWNNGTVVLGMPFGWVLPVSGGYTGAIWAGLAAVALALVGMFFHRRAAAGMNARPVYVERQAYKIVAYATLAVLGVYLLVTVLTLFSVIISSLLLIGSESSISSLYLTVFLPTLLTILIVGFATYCVYRFTTGRSEIAKLYNVLLALGTIVLLALIITVAVRSHDAYSANDYGHASRSLFDESTQDAPLYRY